MQLEIAAVVVGILIIVVLMGKGGESMIDYQQTRSDTQWTKYSWLGGGYTEIYL